MKAKCNKTLFMQGGEQCFTKGKTYEVYEFGDTYLKMFDDNKCPHSVWSGENGWFEHFTVIIEITKSCK